MTAPALAPELGAVLSLFPKCDRCGAPARAPELDPDRPARARCGAAKRAICDATRDGVLSVTNPPCAREGCDHAFGSHLGDDQPCKARACACHAFVLLEAPTTPTAAGRAREEQG